MSKLLLLILINFILIGCINDNKPKFDLDKIEKNMEKRLIIKNDSLSLEKKLVYNKYQCTLSIPKLVNELNDDELKFILNWFNQLPKSIENKLSNSKLIIEVVSQIPEKEMLSLKRDLHQNYLNHLTKVIHSRIGYIDNYPLVPICFHTIPNNQNDSIIIKLKVNELMY